ncbi:MAG: histidinol-phosphate transaminase [Cyclobacteriaceae bacterium]
MKNIMNRRALLKRGALAAGSLTMGAALPWGAVATPNAQPFWTNPPRMTTRAFNWWEYPLKAKLNANENKFGPSKLAQLSLVENANKGNMYAHMEVQALIKKLADKEGVKPEQIILGPGSTDLLEKIAVVTFMDGTGNVISADPAYMSVVRTAQGVGAEWKNIPNLPDWSHDLDAMYKAIDKKTKLVYVCNPNNPTGAITDPKKLWDFCAKASEKVPVFVDEAYLDFMDDEDQKSMVGLINEGKDIIIARTFSKIHGMAGLRVGYVVAKEDRIKAIDGILRSSYNLCVTSLKAAMASLEDTAYLKMSQAKNKEGREFIASEFDKMGIEYIPSYTSFIFFKLKGIEGEAYMKGMYENGVGVRLFEIDGEPWGRVSMGTMEELKMFSKTLKSVLS